MVKKPAKKKPSADGHNGRNKKGQFTIGNKGGNGNPYAKKVALLRSTLFGAVSQEDMRRVVKQLVQEAKSGSAIHIRILFEYLIGKPMERLQIDAVQLQPPLDWESLASATKPHETIDNDWIKREARK